MNIVHLCLANHFSDGYGYQENLLTKYHKKMGLNVTILTSQWTFDNNGILVKTINNDYVNEDGVRVVRLPIIIGTTKNRFKLYKNIYSTIDILQPDIIFIHCPQFLNLLTVARYLSKHKNVTAYVDNHSDYSNSASSWMSKHILHKIVWHYCVSKVKKNINKFYGVLPARVDFMKELYGLNDSQCELLVMGADDDLVKKSEEEKSIGEFKRKYNIAADDFLVVTGGKIDAAKKQTINLMEAVKRISNPKVKLIVFGSVVDELKHKVASLSDGKKIQYIGWIATKDSYNFFASADLVVFPGRHSVFWEQVVAQGKPLVVKDWEGTHHIDIGGNVIYLRKDSTDEMEQVLKAIIKPGSKQYKELRMCAQSEKRKDFLYSIIAKRSIGIDVYEGTFC